MIENFKHFDSTFSMIKYHLVFCPRYRRKIFLIDGVEARFKELVHQICEQNNIDIVAIECDIDHCHIFVVAPPTNSPHDVMKAIKNATTSAFKQEFSELSMASAIWTRSYLASTEPVSSELIKEFVENQKKRWDDNPSVRKK